MFDAPATGTEDRRDQVRRLVAAGLSYRQIAPLVGVSHTQVAKDVRFTPRPPVDRAVLKLSGLQFWPLTCRP